MKKLKINLFGESLIIEQLKPDAFLREWLQTIKTFDTTDFNEALQSPPLLDYVTKCDCQVIIQGLLNTYKNQIEIWFGGKKILKFKMVDLNAKNLLFPLYKCEVNEFPLSVLKPAFYCQRTEIGLIACYETFVEHFTIDDLVFQMLHIENKVLLTGIKYKDCALLSVKSDSLIVRNFYFKNLTSFGINFIP